MNEQAQDSSSSGFNLSDIYFVLFRRKWIILIFSALGIGGAIALLLSKPPTYQSVAKLEIKYLAEKSPLPPGSEPQTRTVLDERPEGIINTEVETLTSLDLGLMVATNVTPERLLGEAAEGGATNQMNAAGYVMKNLTIEPKGTVLTLLYQHPDPQVAQETLRAIITAYAKRRAEMHQSVPMTAKLLEQQFQRASNELAQTMKELVEVKTNAGVVTTLLDEKLAASQMASKIAEDLALAEGQLVQHRALSRSASQIKPVTNSAAIQIPRDVEKAYAEIRQQLDALYRKKSEYISNGFLTTSTHVQGVQKMIDDTEKKVKDMEDKNPQLDARLTTAASGSLTRGIDIASELLQVEALEARIEHLKTKLASARSTIGNLEKWEAPIRELEKKRDRQEADLSFYSTTLARDRMKNAVGLSDEDQGISVVQSPSSPVKKWPKQFKKTVAMVGLGGILGGLALAFVIELFLDHSVKRPVEVETKLGLPLLIAIPDISRNNNRNRPITPRSVALRPSNGQSAENSAGTSTATNEASAIAAVEHQHPLKEFFAGLRDRVIVDFEVRNVVENPKLVAITSCGRGAGVTSIASGLAAALSETGAGNVLLVDMNSEQGASQHFHRGKPECGLEVALSTETKDSARVHPNLYVATEPTNGGGLALALPTRFADMMPKFKASEYDYIIFDMPPVSQTSITPRLSRLMDMVLLVIEAEKTSQNIVKQATGLLAESEVTVSTVLNKTRQYVPKLLHQDFRDNA